MAAKMKVTPKSYAEAAKALNGRDYMVIGHNTTMESRNGEIAVKYHGNRIVRFTPAATFVSWAGWATSTTTARIHQFFNGRANIKGGEPHINGERVEAYAWTEVS